MIKRNKCKAYLQAFVSSVTLEMLIVLCYQTKNGERQQYQNVAMDRDHELNIVLTLKYIV